VVLAGLEGPSAAPGLIVASLGQAAAELLMLALVLLFPTLVLARADVFDDHFVFVNDHLAAGFGGHVNGPWLRVVHRVGGAVGIGVLYSTAGAVADVEDWLDANCAGDWSLSVEGMDDDLIKKSLRIMFETEAEKLRFIN